MPVKIQVNETQNNYNAALSLFESVKRKVGVLRVVQSFRSIKLLTQVKELSPFFFVSLSEVSDTFPKKGLLSFETFIFRLSHTLSDVSFSMCPLSRHPKNLFDKACVCRQFNSDYTTRQEKA